MLSGRTWIDGSGRQWDVIEMTAQHRANVRAWLRDRVGSLRMMVELAELARLGPGDRLEGGPDDRWYRTDAEWLYDQPLFKALVALDSAGTSS